MRNAQQFNARGMQLLHSSIVALSIVQLQHELHPNHNETNQPSK